ncbi:Probable RNA-directed DNA polymerase from transposon X-element [Eumeta japonica]|uniref:Probable RNA-directed DNA polymerase from transposon X-element n=1 Tax=Eumeta variegata TaxID=151549 RepID=A0A4C1W9W3_EUMVA|nr:Probable RNA-directed DNA polymerase from transposon X-element [Eumeta japonica]
MSPTETVLTTLHLLKQNAPGPDGIPTKAIKVIKQLPRRDMVAMTKLFYGILRTGHFPECWKMGRVIAIPKAGKDPRLASIQRPITLLSYIAKLFEHIMLRRLHRHLTPRQEQFGFRSRHTINTPAGANPACACEDSSVVPGGPQLLRYSRGCDLGPVSHQRRDKLQDWEEDVVLALYADNGAYLASSRRADLATAKLQRVLGLLPDWLNRWHVAVNVTKTAALLTGQQRTMPPKLRLRGQEGPYEFLRNIAPTQEGSPSGRPFPRELLKTPPPKN